MLVSDLVRAGTFLALPFVDEPAAIVALAAVNGIATGFFRPAVWAGMPNLVADDEREQATSLLMTVENLAWIVGPVLAGGLLAASGPDIAYWVNAVTFVLSASFVARIPARVAPLRRPDHARSLGRSPGRSEPRRALAPPRHGARRVERRGNRDCLRQRRRGPPREERDRRREPGARLPRRGDGCRARRGQLLRRTGAGRARDDAPLRRLAPGDGLRVRHRLRLADDRRRRRSRRRRDDRQRRRDRVQPGPRAARRAGCDARPCARRAHVELLRRPRSLDGGRGHPRRRRRRARRLGARRHGLSRRLGARIPLHEPYAGRRTGVASADGSLQGSSGCAR